MSTSARQRWATKHALADEAAKAAQREFERAFPVGDVVQWIHSGRGGEFIQSGQILMHGALERLKVRNFKTGRDVWVQAYWLLQAMRWGGEA